MYRPLPKCLTIKKSPIEGLGLYATENIKANTFLGITHILDENFENNYIYIYYFNYSMFFSTAIYIVEI